MGTMADLTPMASPSRSPAGGPLVLIVEDDDDIRFLYAEHLVALGYRTAGEADAERGIAAALRLVPDLILMDLAMAGMSGVDAIRILKSDPRTRRCLIVVVTGSGTKWFEEARAAGCDGFFGKPFDPAALAHILPAVPPRPEPTGPMRALAVKRCSCGRDFTSREWLVLPRAGRMQLSRRGTVVEVRNCPCGSSMALQHGGLESDPGEDRGDWPGEIDAMRRVVVVDRDAHVRRLVLHFIGATYLVEFLDDGYAALDQVRRARPAALVADVMIPRLDGLGLCKLLKGDSSTAEVPVLLMSVLEAGELARAAGADAFVTKPLEKQQFVSSLLAMMEPPAPSSTKAGPFER